MRAGDTVVVVGTGGIGMNAIQGARIAGALAIVAVDPVKFKREQASGFGATHTAASMDEAWSLVSDMTRGKLADVCILTTDVAEASYTAEALALVGKRGRVVVTAIGHPDDSSISGSLLEMTLYEKQIRGALYGSSNAPHDIPRLVELYSAGLLKLDELVTREYSLDQINEGYQDMRSGKNIRGLVRF
ncbi:alcohol dehydrogenase [Mycolicibacterium conceptionense]|uniref:Alcohol dehydrogenase n=1 Tax=Mycolicibacterium conceptionense TaxID=451644 RepID=A0A0U1DTB7_9MYCO|nr:alcohol dehydrogenase [Mycolicibacterium conceptionense]